MNIEVVDFFPIEKDEAKGLMKGTMRIMLPDIGIHIMGILVVKHRYGWYFDIPRKRSIHHETGEPVKYPVFAFDDREQQHSLMLAIREKGRAYIEKRLEDKENPLQWPQMQQEGVSNSKPQAKSEVPAEAKLEASIAKAKPKVWSDPPKRHITARKSPTIFRR